MLNVMKVFQSTMPGIHFKLVVALYRNAGEINQVSVYEIWYFLDDPGCILVSLYVYRHFVCFFKCIHTLLHDCINLLNGM